MSLPHRKPAPARPYPEAPAPTWDGSAVTYALWGKPDVFSEPTEQLPTLPTPDRPLLTRGAWWRVLGWWDRS